MAIEINGDETRAAERRTGRPRRGDGLLQPGRNIWRRAVAPRAAVLVDAAAYFSALRQVMLTARHRIVIVGWDIDSRMRLVGSSGAADDGQPETLAAFLSALVRQRPDLEIKLLLWDYAAIYTLEREKMPALALQWSTPPQVELCLDKMAPVGASHHQKLVVIDDAIAFTGGIDLTIRRWDTPAHNADNPLRTDPAGIAYPPFHDVQLMVDGAAAAALAEVARRRWRRVTREDLAPLKSASDDLWPADIAPRLRDVPLGIARTQPAYDSEPEIREVEALYHDMIASAERCIYIENQFLTCTKVAAALVRRLRERPSLEVVLVTPETYAGWFEQQSMLAGRIRFMQVLEDAGLRHRVRILHPRVGHGEEAAEVKVHAKLMIVDDRLLRIGSANLCNRSFGLDTECDAVLAPAEAVGRAAIARLRAELIGEHCGAKAVEIARLMARHDGSLFAVLDALAGRERRLLPVGEQALAEVAPVAAIGQLADPARPLSAESYLGAPLHGDGDPPPHQSRLGALLKVGGLLLLVAGLVAAWRFSPLADTVSLDSLTDSFNQLSRSRWALPAVFGLFVLGGLLAFPVTLLIAATAAAFGTWPGLPLAAAGAMASALLTYMIGRLIGTAPLRQLMGPRIHRIAARVQAHGIFAVAAIRLVPTAPFTLINLVAGATGIRLSDYLIGSALGLAPGLIVLSALGHGLWQMLSQPSPAQVGAFAAILLVWAAVSFGLQRLVTYLRGRSKAPA